MKCLTSTSRPLAIDEDRNPAFDFFYKDRITLGLRRRERVPSKNEKNESGEYPVRWTLEHLKTRFRNDKHRYEEIARDRPDRLPSLTR